MSGDCSFRFVDVSGIVAQCCSNLLLQDISCLFKRQNYLMQQSNKIRHRKKAICYRNNNKLKKNKIIKMHRKEESKYTGKDGFGKDDT